MNEKKQMHYILKEERFFDGISPMPTIYSVSVLDQEQISRLRKIKATRDLSELSRIVAQEFRDTPISFNKPEEVPDWVIHDDDNGTGTVLSWYRSLDYPDQTHIRKEGIARYSER